MSRFNFQEIYGLISDKSLPIISVGSGMGVDEALMKRKFGCKLITVEPTTNKFDAYREGVRSVEKPDFKYVSQIQGAYPELVGNCVVMLLYPLPDWAMYDIFSIYQMKPRQVVIMYNPFGASGSFLLHNFLRQIDARLSCAKLEMIACQPRFGDIAIIPKGCYSLHTVGYNDASGCAPEKLVLESHNDLKTYKNNKEKYGTMMALVSLHRVKDFDNSKPTPSNMEEKICDGSAEKRFFDMLEAIRSFL
jgi:hypothetical protein